MIKYKQIEAATDMVIATSGYLYINYNRIIHSSSSPYLFDTLSSKTFRDPTGNHVRMLLALYIIDKDNAVSLIWDYTNTEIAKINF
jgi:endo-1,4-beta-D-glucanase Y